VGNSIYVVDAVDGADGTEHVAKVLGVAHLEGELAHRYPVPGGGHRRGQDVDVLVGDGTGDVGQEPGPVQGLHLDPDEEHRVLGGRPAHRHQPLPLGAAQVPQVAAVGPVHRHAVAPGDEPGGVI